MGIAYRDLDLYQGSVFEFRINVNSAGTPVDLTGKTFRLKINNRADTAILELEQDRFTAADGHVMIRIRSVDTESLTPFDDATWDCFYNLGGDEWQLIGYGRAVLKEQT